MFHLACMIVLAIIPGASPARAQSSTNDPVAMFRDAVASVRRLHDIHDEAMKLEEKTPREQTVLLDCIHSRTLKIIGLLDMTANVLTNMQKAIKSEETETVEQSRDDVKTSCARAEKLFLEAQGCSSSMVVTSLPPKAATAVVSNAAVTIKIAPRAGGPMPVVRPVERTEQTCLRQERFAVMLARAMELKLSETAAPDECIKALARIAVEPLGGWQPGKCVTVDNVYVACARAMNLKVKDPEDPLSYGQALREEGLGVDTLLPAREPKLDPPYVLDSEVREFLMTGYAAPLPSAKRVTPD
jgi:hypothetical protein